MSKLTLSNISRPLELYMENSVLDLHGYLTYTPDVDYWVANHIPFDFQNQSLGMTFSGHDFQLNGNGQGGMDGNGQVWYNRFTTHGNAYGRPMPFALVNATNVVVQDWNIIQPQFWAGVIIESSNVLLRNYYTNATNYNESVSGFDEVSLTGRASQRARAGSKTRMVSIPTVQTT